MQFAIPYNQISKQERLICYYTLPRLLHPFTVGLLIAYMLCVAEALGALVFGMITDQPAWTSVGAWSLGGIIVLGLAAFTARALLNDWRRRRALALARKAPHTLDDSDAPDLFAGHVLLSKPRPSSAPETVAQEIGTNRCYSAKALKGHSRWHIFYPEANRVFDLSTVRVHGSYLFATRFLDLFEGEQKKARIALRKKLRGLRTRIDLCSPEAMEYQVCDGCIRHNGRLVGRVYALRNRLYLDVESSHLNPGLVTCFLICW